MTKRSGLALRIACIAVAMTLPVASEAETWVDTRHAIEIDVDSIRTEADGLTYSMERRKYDDEPSPARGRRLHKAGLVFVVLDQIRGGLALEGADGDPGHDGGTAA